MKLPTMRQSAMNISDGAYAGRLNAELWKLQAGNNHDIAFIRLLLDFLKLNLLEISPQMLKARYEDHLNDIAELTINNLGDNKELIARCLDIKILLFSSNIKDYLSTAVNYYWDVFVETEHHEYLVRHLALIRLAKAMFKNSIEDIFDKVSNIVIKLPYPYWQLQVIKQMTPVFGLERCQQLLGQLLEEKIEHLRALQDYSGARLCLQSLEAVGLRTENNSNIEQALLFEEEADQLVHKKEPNTFYPTISQRYSEGLRQLINLPDCKEIKNRIMLKLQNAQLEDSKMVTSVGVSMGPSINYQAIQKKISDLNLSSFHDAFQTLLLLPLLPKKIIDEAAITDEEHQTFLDKAFSKQVKLSGKGKPVGIREGKEAKSNNLRTAQREKLIVMIKMLKDIMDMYAKLAKTQLYEILHKLESPFIPPNRHYNYTEGLGEGFNNNFIVASHLLLPQIENSLRHIAETKSISVTNFKKEEQFENTFGGVLEKLGSSVNEDLYAELQSFFIDSSNVNFRNELLHGLIDSVSTQHFGYYAWWLTLKMVYNSKSYFSLTDNQTVA